MWGIENDLEIIPFCTHKELLTKKGEYIKALGIITAEAKQINYEGIKLLDGFDENGDIISNYYVSLKKLDRVDISLEYIAKKYNISTSTAKTMLERLHELSEMFYENNCLPVINVEEGYRGPSYWINHKAYNKYYTVIRRDVLEKLLLLPANALKLYLVIKYNYELAKQSNKPCVIDMKYLCRSIGLAENSRNRVANILFMMNGKFIKIEAENKHSLVYTSNKKIVNAIRTEYTYEIIQ